ncbi:MAG: 4-hydroxythreonine-4-phosphate dehydrogenase PdxA [Deltaproteobacteria bacterium]|nr:4-hydroxythreonine-4-phosphate dehydrogenase PdxA [Deltaproteobacteria bacterium]
MSYLPRIGITMGDPAGIGPEIVVKALSDPALYAVARPVVIGDPAAIGAFVEEHSGLKMREVSGTSGAGEQASVVDVLPASRLDPGLIRPGVPSLEGGEAMVAAITLAVKLALRGELDAMVTAPISKALMQRAGHPFEGHTQLLAHLTGAREVVMMLAGERLRVVLVTIHCPLRDVPGLLTEEAVLRTLVLADRGLRSDFGIEAPRLAVAALNPHAGEEGLFGDEEEKIIAPAIRRARDRGIDAAGPLPADTVFFKTASGAFDAVVCMYHDQGLIPLKLLHFADGVNVTLGLPIVRTSVDHGTAYDIAGTGRADPSSLEAAVHTAALMAVHRRAAEPAQAS